MLNQTAVACTQSQILWSVTSDGRQAKEMLAGLRRRGRKVSEWAEDIIMKPAFKTSRAVRYDLVGIRGQTFSDERRTTRNIYNDAWRRHWITMLQGHTPPGEVALLLGEKPQEELGCPVAVCHKPVLGSGGYPNLLVLYKDDMGQWLDAWLAFPDTRWPADFAFIFLAPRSSGT